MPDESSRTPTSLDQRIRQRLAQLTEERETAVAHANRTIGVYDGAIAELHGLLDSSSETDDASTTEGTAA